MKTNFIFLSILLSTIAMPNLVWAQGNGSQSDYVDLGLPSGTLWKSQNEKGYLTCYEAKAQYGNHLPSQAQFQELISFCEHTWVGGSMRFTGPNGHSITLSAMGMIPINSDYGDEVYRIGEVGYYWTKNSIDTSAFCFIFSNRNIDIDEFAAGNYKMPVRLVK